jgi:hypothetical protein
MAGSWSDQRRCHEGTTRRWSNVGCAVPASHVEADGSGVVGDQRSADHGPESRPAGGHEQGADGARLDEREQWAKNLRHPEMVEMFPAVRVGHLGDEQVGCLERRKSLSRASRCVHKEKAVRYPEWPEGGVGLGSVAPEERQCKSGAGAATMTPMRSVVRPRGSLAR